MIGLIIRWWSWVAVQFHRAQHIYCSRFQPTTLMEVPEDLDADHRAVLGREPGAEADLALMAARATRARVKVYACGGCSYGHR